MPDCTLLKSKLLFNSLSGEIVRGYCRDWCFLDAAVIDAWRLLGIWRIQNPESLRIGTPSAFKSLFTCMSASASLYLIWSDLVSQSFCRVILSCGFSLISWRSSIWKKAPTWTKPCLPEYCIKVDNCFSCRTYFDQVGRAAFWACSWLCWPPVRREPAVGWRSCLATIRIRIYDLIWV